MIADLPSPLLRSFLAVVDCGSLTAAALRVGRSDSALSLQMSRLEGIVGRPLFDRDGRTLRINAAGSMLTSHARSILARIDAARVDLGQADGVPVRIGIVQDFVADVLRPTLGELRAANPATVFSILIGNTSDLLQAMGQDRIDCALCAGEVLGGKIAASLPVRWFGAVDPAGNLVVPLVGVSPTCPFLAAAQQALDAVGRPWRLALVSPSLDGVRAAVEAGLGITCRTVPGLRLPPLPRGVLPDLVDIAYSVVERRNTLESPRLAAPAMIRHLSALVAS